MVYKYASQKYSKDHMAKAVGTSLPISVKKSVEVCNFIRHRNLATAQKLLEEVMAMKRAVPYKRFNSDTGHKAGKGMAAGRYPVKTCQEILGVLKSVEANAQFKGLSTANLVISHICANEAARPFHHGRNLTYQSFSLI